MIFGAGEVLADCAPLTIAERIGIAFSPTDATFDVVIVVAGHRALRRRSTRGLKE